MTDIPYEVHWVGMDHVDYTDECKDLAEARAHATSLEERGAQMITIYDPDGEEVPLWPGITTLPAGTTLYHGTSADDFDESAEPIKGPAWFTTSLAVAQRFTRFHEDEGTPRVITYELKEPLVLPKVESQKELQQLLESHGIEGGLTHSEQRDRIATTKLNGWVIPNNYPDGDDILITKPDGQTLVFKNTQVIGSNADDTMPDEEDLSIAADRIGLLHRPK